MRGLMNNCDEHVEIASSAIIGLTDKVLRRIMIDMFSEHRAVEPSSDDPLRVNQETKEHIKSRILQAIEEKEKPTCATVTPQDAAMGT
jgi:hypothetical protein